jgi:hypothetical protein
MNPTSKRIWALLIAPPLLILTLILAFGAFFILVFAKMPPTSPEETVQNYIAGTFVAIGAMASLAGFIVVLRWAMRAPTKAAGSNLQREVRGPCESHAGYDLTKENP